MSRARRRSSALAVFLAFASLPAPALAHTLDHPVPAFTAGIPTGGVSIQGGIDGVSWGSVTTFLTGNPHTDVDFFSQAGDIYASVGTLAVGPNGGGQSIFRMTEDGEVSPSFVVGVPTASCLSDPSAALGLQHDVEATPKGAATMLHTDYPGADLRDAQLLIDATDGGGRCHDQAGLGDGFLSSNPRGGLEFIDITDINNPVEIGLTSHVGESHTVNIDPRRSHIVYSVSSDSIGVQVDDEDFDGDGDTTELIRQDEDPGDSDAGDLSGFEILDISSCMNFPEGTTVATKREACRPDVFRYRYETLDISIGHSNPTQVHGCHELEVYPNDLLTCGGGDAGMIFDISGLFNDNGTPDNYLDDTINGTPLDCTIRPSMSQLLVTTGAMVTDCTDSPADGDDDLFIPPWLAAGAPSAEGIVWLKSAYHMGREGTQGSVLTPSFGSAEDIDFNHEVEFSQSGKFIIATDERGGGVLPGGASCSPGFDIDQGNGGIHAYAVDRLKTAPPATPDEAFESYARTPDGEKAIFRVPVRTAPQGTECTAHVFHQIPGQNRIFMAWYSQGTVIIDYIEHEDGTFEWVEVGHQILPGANNWASEVFKADENPDGSFTYYGLATDFNLGNGRSTVDVYTVTAPAPAQAAQAPAPAPTPTTPAPAPTAEPTPDTLPATGAGMPLGALPLLGIAALGMRTLTGDRRRQTV